MKVLFEKIFHSDMPKRLRDALVRRSRRLLAVYLLYALCIAVLQLFNTASLYAQAAPNDRAPVHVRYPAPDHLHDLQTDRNYQYGHDVPPPDSPVARFLDWLLRKLSDFLSSKAYQNVWQYVILAIIAGAVIYLLMKAEVLDFLFPKKAQSAGLDYENLVENIHEINFDAAINDAVEQRNFRLAVRLLYLQTLKHLADAGRIDYKPEKTNRQYVYELANSSLQPDFERLTRQFEFVWYGDLSIDEAQFARLQTAFRQVNKASEQPTI